MLCRKSGIRFKSFSCVWSRSNRRRLSVLSSPCLKLRQKKLLLIRSKLVHKGHETLCGLVGPILGNGDGLLFCLKAKKVINGDTKKPGEPHGGVIVRLSFSSFPAPNSRLGHAEGIGKRLLRSVSSCFP